MPLSIGIDVQVKRPCALAILDSQCRLVDSGWLEGGTPSEMIADLVARLSGLRQGEPIQIGIDAPRQPLIESRRYYWDRKHRSWRDRKPADKGWGRHCEVVIRASGLANPQWTPPEAVSPDWMRLGYGLFQELTRQGFEIHEVFPSASYSQLEGVCHSPVSIEFTHFSRGPKDLLDAVCAAFTIHEFRHGRGVEVGSDGLGTIVLPRPLPNDLPRELMEYPVRG